MKGFKRLLTVALAMLMLMGVVAPMALAAQQGPSIIFTFRGSVNISQNQFDANNTRSWVGPRSTNNNIQVRNAQAAVNSVGQSQEPHLRFSTGTVDGMYGPNTERGIRAYQNHRRIGVDGVVGITTWTNLNTQRGAHTGWRIPM